MIIKPLLHNHHHVLINPKLRDLSQKIASDMDSPEFADFVAQAQLYNQQQTLISQEWLFAPKIKSNESLFFDSEKIKPLQDLHDDEVLTVCDSLTIETKVDNLAFATSTQNTKQPKQGLFGNNPDEVQKNIEQAAINKKLKIALFDRDWSNQFYIMVFTFKNFINRDPLNSFSDLRAFEWHPQFKNPIGKKDHNKEWHKILQKVSESFSVLPWLI